MSRFIIAIIFLLITSLSCKKREHNSHQIPPSEQAVNKLLAQSANYLKRKYQIEPIGTRAAMPEGIVNALGLNFKIYKPLTHQSIRKILINIGNDFLNLINNDATLKPYLIKHPFTIKNIEIVLFFTDVKGFGLRDPYIGIAEINKGQLAYSILIETDTLTEKARYEESYEEALQKLAKEPLIDEQPTSPQ